MQTVCGYADHLLRVSRGASKSVSLIRRPMVQLNATHGYYGSLQSEPLVINYQLLELATQWTDLRMSDIQEVAC